MAVPANYVTPLAASPKAEGRALAKLIDAPARRPEAETPTARGVEDIAGTYTGTWASNDYGVSGALVMNVAVSGEMVEARITLTGSEYLKSDTLKATMIPAGAGVWRMDFKGQKVSGTGLFRGDSFTGDYKFKKLLWTDHGQWVLKKAE